MASIKLMGDYALRKMLDLPPFAEVDSGSDPPVEVDDQGDG